MDEPRSTHQFLFVQLPSQLLGQQSSSGLIKIMAMVETKPLEMPIEIVKDMAMTVLKGMSIRMPTGVSKAMATSTAMAEVSVMEPMANGRGGNMAPAVNAWGNGWGNIGVQSQNFHRDPEASRKRGDLVARPGFTNYLARSLTAIHCPDFAVKGLFCPGLTCTLKHLTMQKWTKSEKDDQFGHMNRNQGNIKFCSNIRWLPDNMCHLIENGES